MRDDFSSNTKNTLAHRVGFRCSNPDCRKLTSGPTDDAKKYVNIGVAAHICAASQGGKRYNENMTSEQRKDINNGIWLCQSCAKLIDSDEIKYNIDLIETWKSTAEQLAQAENSQSSSIKLNNNDIDIIKFYSECIDRPAFQDEIRQEGNMENFERAIEDTIIAFNTGVLKDRNGSLLKQSQGKSAIKNDVWREKLYMIVDLLNLINKRLKIAKKEGTYQLNNSKNSYDSFYCFHDRELEVWFDTSRIEVINIFSSICKEAGIPIHKFPRMYYRY
ncbi:MAG: HNH endonuclease [Clostridia bacterium]|nr:HNH endonuclease [Clostridia bacterium]